MNELTEADIERLKMEFPLACRQVFPGTKFNEELMHRWIQGVCAVGIILTCAVVIWSELR